MHWTSVIFQILLTTEAVLANYGERKDNPLLSTDFTTCGVVPTCCQECKYRSYDGSCNNLKFGYWGTPNTTYVRLLANTYSDGVSAYPKSVTGDELPNPRAISLGTYVDIPKLDELWTVYFMQFGQVVAHDLSLAAGLVQTKKEAVVCCSKGQLTEAAKTNKRCAPIKIPRCDPYGGPEGMKCMDFLRTLSTHDAEKCIGVTKVAEPLTAVTSFLDASYMYSSDENVANKVREFKGGRLASVMRHGRELLPQHPDPEQVCNVQEKTEPCYVAGDVRLNQNPQLALCHNLIMLLHNNIAHSLTHANPHWNDETLFQETRRIVIAILQHIIYYEFLPPMIGKKNMIDNKLIYPNATGHIRDYDPNVNPGMSIEAATAALRDFHSEIVGGINLITEYRNVSNNIRLRECMDKPSVCEHANNFNELTIGLATQPQSAVDRFITKDILNLMFRDGLLGQDLKAIDIWRGRDQGLGTYVQALKMCGLSNPKSFNDLKMFIKSEYVDILRNHYACYQDVDLAVAMTLETRTPNSLSGPTGQCFLLDQFKRSRVGDRFFYENGQGKCAFTIDQLKEIRRHTSAGILCSNPDIILMQREAFKLISDKNPLTTCNNIPKFNPEPWRE